MIIVLAWGLVTGLTADMPSETDTSRSSATAKILHFPADQYMGSLSMEDPCLGSAYSETGRDLSYPFGFDPVRVCLTGDWDFVGRAQGSLTVPVDSNLQLVVLPRPLESDIPRLSQLSRDFLNDRLVIGPEDLSGLSSLAPDDLYSLRVSSSISRRDADTRILEPISRLTGLRILSLHMTGVTNRQMVLLTSLRSLQALELGREYSLGNTGLAVLRDLPALEYLDCDTSATDSGMAHLGQLPNLRWLRLRMGKIRGSGLAHLANLPRLERLALWGTTGLTDRHIRYLEGLTRLKSLTLWGNDTPLTDATLASLAKLTSLEELYFIRVTTNFTPAGMAQLKTLKHLRKLEFANISDAQFLTALPQLESVKPVVLTSDNMKALGSLNHLKSLSVVLVPLPDDQTRDAAACLGALNSLEELNFCGSIRGAHLSDDDVAHFESLVNLKKLGLSLGSRLLTERSLASIGKLKRLESLSFSGDVTKRGLNHLNSLANLKTLSIRMRSEKSSNIDETPLNLSALTNLRTLTLSGLPFQGSDWAFLANMRHLEWLDLQGNQNPETAMVHIRNLQALKRLHISNLNCTTSNDLACLAGLRKLESLRLRGHITDAALNQIGNLPVLQGLNMETDQLIRSETIARLKERLPSLDSVEIQQPMHSNSPSFQIKPPPRRTPRRSSRSRRQSPQTRRQRSP